MYLLSTSDIEWQRQSDALLLSQHIPRRWHYQESSVSFLLEVPDGHYDVAEYLLSQQYVEDLQRHAQRSRQTKSGPLLLEPAFAASLSFACLLALLFALFGPHTATYRQMIFHAPALGYGQWWRLISAALLHADLPHLFGNAGFMLVLGWAAAECVGAGYMLFFWLLTALGGFAVSFGLSDIVNTVGSSGGLYGLLGVAGGHGIRHPRNPQDSRRPRLRVFGAVVLFLAFTAFSPRANIYAHVGGFIVGLALGYVSPKEKPKPFWQLGVFVMTVLVCGWGLLSAMR